MMDRVAGNELRMGSSRRVARGLAVGVLAVAWWVFVIALCWWVGWPSPVGAQ